MEPWVSENSPALQLLVAAGVAVAGAVLAVVCRDFGTLATNTGAGFLLGVLLLLGGIAGLLWSGKQTVTVDPRTRLIRVEDARLIGAKTRSIPFADVASVRIGYSGKRSSFVNMYYLALKLRDGTTYPLFAAGRFYKGSSDRDVVEGRRRRLEGYLSGGR